MDYDKLISIPDKTLVHAHEQVFRDLNNQIFSLEKMFEDRDHPVRQLLYKARIEIGMASTINRQSKNHIQNTWVFEDKKKP